MTNTIEASTERLVLELVDQMPEIELVEIEYVHEHDWYLRVYIDKEGGVDLDDCQMFSEKLGALLDRENFIKDAYILEVSSPGLDRVLKKPRDFVRERGKSVDVSFYAPFDGKKSLTGVLAGYDGEFLMLEGMEPIPTAKISQIRLHVDF